MPWYFLYDTHTNSEEVKHRPCNDSLIVLFHFDFSSPTSQKKTRRLKWAPRMFFNISFHSVLGIEWHDSFLSSLKASTASQVTTCTNTICLTPKSENGTISTTHLHNVPLSQTEIYESSFVRSLIYPVYVVTSTNCFQEWTNACRTKKASPMSSPVSFFKLKLDALYITEY